MGIHYFFSSNFTPNNENIDCEYLFSKVCVEQKKKICIKFFSDRNCHYYSNENRSMHRPVHVINTSISI